MTQRGSFFDSTAGDRIYDSATMARALAAVVSDGVVTTVGTTNLVVTEQTPAAMGVKVGLGLAFVKGYYFEVYSTTEPIVIGAANATNPRIDRIVIRRDLGNRTISLVVLVGTPAVSPVPPALTQVAGGTWDFSLAQVRVNAAATSIVNANITDERTYATAALGSSFDATTGHHHDGVDSRKATYTDLNSIPATFSPNAHAHTLGSTPGQVAYTSLTAIPTTFAPAAHLHAAASVEGQVPYTNLSAVPTAFAPAAHTHAAATVPGQVPYANLSGIPTTFAPTAHAAAHGLAGADAVTVPWTFVSSKPTTFAPSAHAHAAASVEGQVPYASLTGIPATFAPSVHAANHKTGGSDVIKASEVGGFDRVATIGTVGTRIFVGTTAPTSPAEGDLWVKA